MTIVAALTDTTYGNPARITSAERQGDCVVLTGQYGGGCVADDLRASAERSALAVYPPVYVVTLYDAANDSCSALVTGSAAFSIARIRAEDARFDLHLRGAEGLVIEVR